MNIPGHGRGNNGSGNRPAAILIQQRLKDIDGRLHCLGRRNQLGQIIDSFVKQHADLVDCGNQTRVQKPPGRIFLRTLPGKQIDPSAGSLQHGLIQRMLRHNLLPAVCSFLCGSVPSRPGLSPGYGRRLSPGRIRLLSAHFLNVAQRRSLPARKQVRGQGSIAHKLLARIRNCHRKPRADCHGQEGAVNILPPRKSVRDIGKPRDYGKALLPAPANRLKRLPSGLRIGSRRMNQRIYNNILL